MKFLADMAISARTVSWLRLQGHDVIHVREIGMARARDAEILARALHEARIVLTLDLDFGYLLSISGSQLPSVILFRLGNETATVVTQRLDAVLTCCTDALKSGALVIVDEQRIRVRQLPLSLEWGQK